MKKLLRKIIAFRNRILRRLFVLFRSKISGTRVKLGTRVVFNQKTIITGKGTVRIGNNVSIGYKLGGNFYKGISEIQPRYRDSVIEIGDNVAFNNNIFICSANTVRIGNNCLIGEGVSIHDFEAHGTLPQERHNLGAVKQVIIGDNVWIGSKVIILKGAVIGDNSIIAVGSVVLGKEYPPNVIIGGNPAKVIKEITSNDK